MRCQKLIDEGLVKGDARGLVLKGRFGDLGFQRSLLEMIVIQVRMKTERLGKDLYQGPPF